MRPQQQNRRMRGRNNNNNNNNNSNNNRKGPNPLTRSYESNGPDVKIRGSAQQIAEKYTTLARDAHSSGDRVMAENYLQHAEHYNRIIMAAQGQMPVSVLRDQRDEFDDEDGDDASDQGGQGNQPQDPRQQDARGNDGRQQDGRQQDGRQPENRQQNDGRQRDQRRDDNRRDENRRDDSRRDGEPRRDLQPVADASATAQPQPQPNDGSGPQPVIEGMPVEVALEQEAMAGQKTGRRRGRPPRAKVPEGEAVGTRQDTSAAQAPTAQAAAPAAQDAAPAAEATAPDAGEDDAPRRARRPRRPRNRADGDSEGAESPDETPVPAQ